MNVVSIMKLIFLMWWHTWQLSEWPKQKTGMTSAMKINSTRLRTLKDKF